MATLRNHPGFWMRDDAEASLARWEADHGVIGVNSAGRYEWEQQALINRWNQGGTYNRPPYLYEPKRPASASAHVANGGVAFDTSEYVRFRRTCADYGWWQPYDWDVVHFEYNPARDKHRGGSASKPKPKPETPTKPTLEDLMALKNVTIATENGKNQYDSTTLDFETGMKSSLSKTNATYTTTVAKYLTGQGSLTITKGHYDNLLREFDAHFKAKREHELAVARAQAGK